MVEDVSQSLEDAISSDHAGFEHPVTIIRNPLRPGAPRKVIDPYWLAWAITRRNTSDIARFLGVGRDLVSQSLVDYGLRTRGEDPFIRHRNPNDHNIIHYEQVSSVSGDVCSWSDNELDSALVQLRILFPRGGVAMLKGALASMGYNVPRERVRLSLRRINPEHRLFQRLIIQRRQYWVPGPNFL